MDKKDHKSYIVNRKSSFGFTLIELLVAISIFLVIGTFSTNFYTGFLTQNAVSNTQDQLLGSLRKAQMYAMAGKAGTNWGVHYDSATHKITVFSGTSYATRTQAYDENYSVNPNISVTGITDIVFTRLTGVPNTSGTIVITGNSETKTITIDSQGVASR